jgi:hypothetical protein
MSLKNSSIVPNDKGEYVNRIYFYLLALLLVSSCTTTEPLQKPEDEFLEFGTVSFSGDECTVSGPTEILTGKYHIDLNNLSEVELRMGVVRLLDGKTFQDMVDFQGESGKYIPFIPFISYPRFFTSDHINYYYYLDEPGEYYIGVQDSLKTHLWLCSAFHVIETSPD